MLKALIAAIALATLSPAVLAATPATIHEAAALGDLKTVQTLLKDKPTLLNARDKNGATPLHCAVAGGHGSMSEFLITRKADVNARKPDGVTPLHVAASLGHQGITRSLIARKADVNAIDKKGRTPLSLAQGKGHGETAALLRKAGAKAPPVKPKAVKPVGRSEATAKLDLRALSLDLTRRMDRGDFAAMVKRFDSTMAASLTEAQLRQMWSQLTAQAGRFQMTGAVRQEKVVQDGKRLDVIIVPARFGQTPLNVQFAYNSEGRISGFFILNPSQTP